MGAEATRDLYRATVLSSPARGDPGRAQLFLCRNDWQSIQLHAFGDVNGWLQERPD